MTAPAAVRLHDVIATPLSPEGWDYRCSTCGTTGRTPPALPCPGPPALAAVTAPGTLVRTDAPDTGHAAALAALGRSGGARARIFRALVSRGLTDPELQAVTSVGPNTERPRRVELVRAGLVHDSGERRRHHGCDHIVWSLTPAGVEVAGELAALT